MKHLETARLILRPFEEQDYPLILKISSDPDTVKYLFHWGHPGITPEADAHRFLSHALNEWARTPVRVREYCIVLKETGETLGEGSVEYWDDDEKTAELGWILTPEYRGKGYVTDILGLEPYKEMLPYAGHVFLLHGTGDEIAHPAYTETAVMTYWKDRENGNKGETFGQVLYDLIDNGQHGFTPEQDEIALDLLQEFILTV